MMEEPVHWPSAVAGDILGHHDAKVIEIRDYGSRAKQMAGPESDIDAMVIFTQPPVDHKLLDGYTDAISTKMYGVDIQGWSLRKFTDLLADSNPSAIEFLNSKSVYWTATPEDIIATLLDELHHYANRNFNPIRLYYHYRHMARDNYRKYIKKSKDMSASRNLTVVRAALYARHIRRTGDFPGMDFPHFLDHSVADDIADRVTSMLEVKTQRGGDQYVGNPFHDLIEYEINIDVDEDELNRRGIDRERMNQFMTEVDDAVF